MTVDAAIIGLGYVGLPLAREATRAGLAVDGGPDLGHVRSAVAAIARNLRPGVLVVIESTPYPGTTDEVIRPTPMPGTPDELIRPRLEATGLVAGVDFNLAFSPERVHPGNRQFGLCNTPKVVGGHTPAYTDRAASFYGGFVATVVRTKGTR